MVDIDLLADIQGDKFIEQSNKIKEEALIEAFRKYGYSVEQITDLTKQNRIYVNFHNTGDGRSDPCVEVFYLDGEALFALIWWTTYGYDYSEFKFHQYCMPIKEVSNDKT